MREYRFKHINLNITSATRNALYRVGFASLDDILMFDDTGILPINCRQINVATWNDFNEISVGRINELNNALKEAGRERLKRVRPTKETLYIMGQLDALDEAIEALQYCRGKNQCLEMLKSIKERLV